VNDRALGDAAHSNEELSEAGWHFVSGGLNAFTCEGGEALEGAAHEGMNAKEIVHATHVVADAHEMAWDTGSTIVGDKEKLPTFGNIIPWIANGAGRKDEGRQ
jgi:hypothetical protein